MSVQGTKHRPNPSVGSLGKFSSKQIAGEIKRRQKASAPPARQRTMQNSGRKTR